MSRAAVARALIGAGSFLLLAAGTGNCQQQPPPQHETVIVTGTYDPIPMQESDRNIDVQNIPPGRALLANTVVDFLQLDSSIDLQQRAPNGIQSDMSIRGTNFGQTLILLNGLRISDVQTGHYSMDLPVPLEGIDRIEVLKGAGSTMYGSDAVGGAVNIVTRTPESGDFSVRLGMGNFGTNQQRADGTFVLGPWSQSVWFSRDFSDGFTYDRDYRDLQFGSGTHLKEGWGATDITLGYGDRPYGADQFYGNFNSFERTKVWFAGLHQTFGEQTEADFGYRRHSDLFVLFRDNPSYFTNRHIDDTTQAAVRRWEKLGVNTRLHYGGEVIHDGIDSNNLGQHTRTRGSAFVSLDVRALNRFSFSLGAREELFGGGQSQFSPSAAAGYWLTTKLHLHGSVTHAFRLPSYTDLYYHDPGNVGNPNLRPEKAWDYEGGADWYFSRRLRAGVNVFELREQDVIDYVRSAPNAIYQATNFDRLNYTGAEVSLKYDGFAVSYTALHGAFNVSQVLQSKYTAYYPSHEAIASWEGALKGVALRTRVGALQRYHADPYGLWDVYAAWSRGHVHPFLQLTNLTNTVYQEVAGVAMPKRSVLGGIELRLR